ncbi:hypothetical protein [Nocardia altamirensis]|uniref:hypothetical protein n=1 Tax=Nocardia altamirensis TaxID=472158 RepID=UPI0008406941|nr:hypothetical protein [Nocardia altamirensis]
MSCVFATAAPLLVLAPAAEANPGSPYSCSESVPSKDGSSDVESCIYVENGVPRAFGGLVIKDDSLTPYNCTMVVKVIDFDAYKTGDNEEVADSGKLPCTNGRYPSPPMTVDSAKAKPGHSYGSYTEITRYNDGVARIYSPRVVL